LRRDGDKQPWLAGALDLGTKAWDTRSDETAAAEAEKPKKRIAANYE
jgi:hypothetical protein